MDLLLDTVKECCADSYAVERELGRGSTAIVYLAKDLRHKRQVAIKLLHPELALVVGSERFKREIDIAAKLTHPHILPLLHSGVIEVGAEEVGGIGGRRIQLPYYVMPFISGESLRERLARDRRLDEPEALQIAREVADALDYAHREGVVHRDIKPENILLSGGHAVVADFGIARALDQAGKDRMTGTGMLVGTPQYMSPEQVSGDHDVDGRADLYALGSVLYEMLAGAPPFVSNSVQQVLARRLSETAPTLLTSGVRVRPFVQQALSRVLAVNPADRFATGAEFAKALTGEEPAEQEQRLSRSALLVGVPLAIAIGLAVLAPLIRKVTGRGASPSIAAVAVYPLAEIGADPATAYLREGIAETVADLLRKLPQLTVAAPSLVTQLLDRQPNADLREVARRLGVGAFVAGRMRRLGDSLHLRTELVRVEDGKLLWSHTYAGPFDRLLDVEQQIARSVADSLRVVVTAEQANTMARRSIDDPVAYDLYLQGRHVWMKATPLGASSAVLNADSVAYYAEQVRARAPKFAGGYFLQSAYYTLAAFRGWRRPIGPVLDSGKIAARQTIAIDSTFGEAWNILGIINYFTTEDWPETKRLLRRGVELNPASPSGRTFYAIYLGEIERSLDSAIAQLRAAVDLDSTVTVLNSLGDMYIRARKYDSAAIALSRAINVDASVTGPRNRLIRSLEALGKYDSALAVRRGASDTSSLAGFERGFKQSGAAGYRKALAADLRQRADSIERALAGPKNEVADTVPPSREYRIAQLYALLGDWKRAGDWVLKDYARRPKRIRAVLANPDFDGLHQDPRIVERARAEGTGDLLPR